MLKKILRKTQFKTVSFQIQSRQTETKRIKRSLQTIFDGKRGDLTETRKQSLIDKQNQIKTRETRQRN